MAFPTVQGRDGVTGPTSDATSFTVPFAAGWNANRAGDRVYCFVSVDGHPALSTATAGWVLVDQKAATTQAEGALFAYVAAADNTAVPPLVVTSDVAEQFSARMLWVRSSTGAIAHLVAKTGGSAVVTPDPAPVTNSSPDGQECLIVVSYNGDGTVEPTAAPAGYSALAVQPAGGTTGATTATAERIVTLAAGASEDPGAFTVPTIEQWNAFTVAIYETEASIGLVRAWEGGAWISKPVKVWDGSSWISKPLKFHDGSSWAAA